MKNLKYVQTFSQYLNESLLEGTTPQFQELIKKAREMKIETVDELTDLICDKFSDEKRPITGADFEIAKKTLKLKK